jgi:hypothetical protein
MTKALMNKFLHPTLQAIKAAAAEGDSDRLETFRSTFDIQRAANYTQAHSASADPARTSDPKLDPEPTPKPTFDPEKPS